MPRRNFSVFKKSLGEGRKSPTWWAKVGLPGRDPEKFNTQRTDKRAALKVAEERYAELEREAAGLAIPKLLQDATRIPLVAFLDDFVAQGGARGNAGIRHLKNVRTSLVRVFSLLGWKYLRDVDADAFKRLRHADTSLSSRTWDRVLGEVKTLMRWLVAGGRLLVDPFASVGKDRRRRIKWPRRALTETEIERLLSVAKGRRPIYLLALKFGLRRGELHGLTWNMIDRSGSPWLLTIPAGLTKNRTMAQFPIPPDVQRELERLKPGPGGRLFPKKAASALRLRTDLEAAGIPFVDASGRRVDFHALRVTAITLARRAGVDPFQARLFARHSDQRLTDSVYTDVSRLPVADVVNRLPDWSASVESAVPSAWGKRGNPWVLERVPERDRKGHFLSSSGVDSPSTLPAKNIKTSLQKAGFDGVCLQKSAMDRKWAQQDLNL